MQSLTRARPKRNNLINFVVITAKLWWESFCAFVSTKKILAQGEFTLLGVNRGVARRYCLLPLCVFDELPRTEKRWHRSTFFFSVTAKEKNAGTNRTKKRYWIGLHFSPVSVLLFSLHEWNLPTRLDWQLCLSLILRDEKRFQLYRASSNDVAHQQLYLTVVLLVGVEHQKRSCRPAARRAVEATKMPLVSSIAESWPN